MRLWSIHPKYLDPKGLLALWREGLLAQKVLFGLTKGYKHHPQLARFLKTEDPILAISAYLTEVVNEADRRRYSFDRTKIKQTETCPKIIVTSGQVEYEWKHLMTKLEQRAITIYQKNYPILEPETHPLFIKVPGTVEEWEKLST